MALEKHGIRPAAGEILVTGAAGGVGSVAVAILAKLGFSVVAATGRPQEADYLKALGATTVMDRKELTEAPDRPLLSERFAGLVDTVSGVMFARALAQVKYGGAAAVCGLAGGPSFPGSILPFILRSIAVYGIDSVMLPKGPRQEAWRRLGTDLPLDKLDSTVSEAGLSDLMGLAPRILKGEVRGRVVVDVSR
jgi:acrylyl-CoA reductase (NADPH)